MEMKKLEMHDPDLKSQNDVIELGLLDGQYNGGGKYLGIPYGGSNDGSYDGKCNGGEGDNFCDSICNMFGIGWDYCFSRNGNYKLNNGKYANTTDGQSSNFFYFNTRKR